jgi:hypothetical protein
MTQIFNERLAVIWRCSKNPDAAPYEWQGQLL